MTLFQDDLAEHTIPSPVYAEDAAYEAMDGHSDWEYYSDDYYDDDPTLLKDNPQEGRPLRRSKSDRSNGLHRGTKRKLADTSDVQINSSVMTSWSTLGLWNPSIKATVWRSSSVEDKEKKLYVPGMGERVALLGNWREVFKSSQPFGRQQRNSELGTCMKRDNGYGEISPIPTTKPSLPQKVLNGHREEPDTNEDGGAAPKDCKRRRTAYLQGPPTSRNHKVVVEIPVQRVNRVTKDRPEDRTETASTPSASRKRKANDVEHDNIDGAVPKPPAKRTAAGRVPAKSKEKAKPPPLPSARTTRSRKK